MASSHQSGSVENEEPLESANGTDEDEGLVMQDMTLTPIVAMVDVVADVQHHMALLEGTRHQKMLYGYSCDIGMTRANNEDSTLVLFGSQSNSGAIPDFGLFIVADGAGGHEDGEQASAKASDVVAEHIIHNIYTPVIARSMRDDVEPLLPISEVLAEALNVADAALKADVPGGGTTLTAAVLIGDLAHIAHVGDSRAYLIVPESETGSNGMEKLTRDHTVATRLQEIGQIGPDEILDHPEVERVWMLLGLSETVIPDVNTRRLSPGSHLVLCSDGLWNMVPDAMIKQTVLNAETPQEACDKLVALANANGGVDNISAIVLRAPAK